DDDKDNAYYYQFIGINSRNGDTVRILTPLISFPSPENPTQKTFTMPTMINGSKQISEATYNLTDSNSNLMLQVSMNPEQGKISNSEELASLMHGMKMKQWVVVNKSMSIFEDPSYPTAIGILHFSEKP